MLVKLTQGWYYFYLCPLCETAAAMTLVDLDSDSSSGWVRNTDCFAGVGLSTGGGGVVVVVVAVGVTTVVGLDDSSSGAFVDATTGS